jgi:2-(1,2-epoxy-1,2-dihydrophenyl)acetyl-CoA isomerase
VTEPAVLMTREGSTLVLTLNQPKARNALSTEIRDGLAAGIALAKSDAEVRAVVITGAGGHFCAGGDIRGMQQSLQQVPPFEGADWRARMQTTQAVFSDLMGLHCPVIAAVDGSAYGAGFSLALAADLVLATPAARFCLSFMRLGLVPDCGAFHTLPRVVGVQRAKELMLSAREVGADEALRLGIAMEVQPTERLLPRALELANSFADASPLAVSLIKRAMGGAGELATQMEAEANAQALAFSSNYFQNAVRRFLGKQAPAFQWPKE